MFLCDRNLDRPCQINSRGTRGGHNTPRSAGHLVEGWESGWGRGGVDKGVLWSQKGTNFQPANQQEHMRVNLELEVLYFR